MELEDLSSYVRQEDVISKVYLAQHYSDYIFPKFFCKHLHIKWSKEQRLCGLQFGPYADQKKNLIYRWFPKRLVARGGSLPNESKDVQ